MCVCKRHVEYYACAETGNLEANSIGVTVDLMLFGSASVVSRKALEVNCYHSYCDSVNCFIVAVLCI